MAAAIEGAFFGITSIAVSLEYDEQARYDKAAQLAVPIIEQILAQKDSEPQLYNLNIPLEALEGAGRGARRADVRGAVGRGVRAPARPARPAVLLGDRPAAGAADARADRPVRTCGPGTSRSRRCTST